MSMHKNKGIKTKRKNSQRIHQRRFLLGWIGSGIIVLFVGYAILAFIETLDTRPYLILYPTDHQWRKPPDTKLGLLIISIVYSLLIGFVQEYLIRVNLKQILPRWRLGTLIGAIGSGIVGILLLEIFPMFTDWWWVLIYLAGISLTQMFILGDYINRRGIWTVVHVIGALIMVIPTMVYRELVHFPQPCGYMRHDCSNYLPALYAALDLWQIFLLGLLAFIAITGLTMLYLIENQRKERVV